VAALFVVSNARADEYTKQTYLTFSGPVQLPGITLPGGTYMFKLADPETGRRVLQVWDKEGTKLYTTLMTIPDEKMDVSDKPVVLFSERPSGQAQAIKSWFYPDERTGYEFVYPKAQATQIARENHASVLSYTDDSAKASDAASMKSAKIGRVDENGQPLEQGKAAENHAADNSAVTNHNASRSQAPAAATTAADNDNAASSTTTRAGATTARADNSQSNTAQSTTAPRTNRAVGTSGTTAAPQSNTSRTLPKTASPLASIELLSALSLLGGLGAHQLRKRTADARG
jgi:hypothetical protein